MGEHMHTPAPWSFDRDWHRLPTILASDGKTKIATVEKAGRNEYTPAQEANARLISAAPDMLDALKDWIAYAEENLHEFDPDIDQCSGETLCPQCESAGCIQDKIARARAAITKATGA